MSANSAAIQNDAQGWADDGNATYTGPNWQGIYNGNNVPDVSFVVTQVSAMSGQAVTTTGLFGLWQSVIGGEWFDAKEAIKAFAEDAATPRGNSNMARHFWVIDGAGGVTGLLMYTNGWQRGAIAVTGYLGWVPNEGDVTLYTRATHTSLEQKALGYLKKQLGA